MLVIGVGAATVLETRAHRQSAGLDVAFVLKTERPPETVAPAARAAIESVDRDQPIFAVSSMEDVIAGTVAQERRSWC